MRKPHKPHKNSNVFQSISTAFKGLILIIKNETAIKMMVFSLVLFTLLAIRFNLPLMQIFFISFAWLLVLILEINNTAIEIDMDYSSNKEYSPMIKKVKDYAAATVFLASSFALVLTTTLFCQALSNG